MLVKSECKLSEQITKKVVEMYITYEKERFTYRDTKRKRKKYRIKAIKNRQGKMAFLSLLFNVLKYRIAMPVSEVMVFRTLSCRDARSYVTGFYVCPWCKITLEREYMSYCDRCGQRLDWRKCMNAKIIYPENER